MSNIVERLKAPLNEIPAQESDGHIVALQAVEIARLHALCAEAASVLEMVAMRSITLGQMSANLCALTVDLVSQLPNAMPATEHMNKALTRMTDIMEQEKVRRTAATKQAEDEKRIAEAQTASTADIAQAAEEIKPTTE